MTEIYIKELSEIDVSDNYLKWMNDTEINRYLESRFSTYTLEELKDFVKEQQRSKTSYLFGIYTKTDDIHIGNIKIGGIDPHHKRGSIGLIIGNKEYWGKGIGTKAVKLLLEFVFESLKLNKVTAGMYKNNIGSYKLFKQLGFKEAAHYKEHSMYNGSFVDTYVFELLKKDYYSTNKIDK